MSSFTLLLMVISFMHVSPIYQSPSQYLINFLKYYGEVFDYKKTSIVGDRIVKLYEEQYLNGLENASLSISSPLQPGINIAYNVTRFEEIKTCFLETYNKIMKLKDSVDHEKILDKILA